MKLRPKPVESNKYRAYWGATQWHISPINTGYPTILFSGDRQDVIKKLEELDAKI